MKFQAAVHSVTQKVLFIDGEDSDLQKKAILLEFFENLKKGEKVIVFVGKKARVDDLSSDFALKGINCQVSRDFHNYYSYSLTKIGKTPRHTGQLKNTPLAKNGTWQIQ
jgi:hypothetical protein